MHTATLAPVLLTSAVTGDGLGLVRLFYNLLPPRQRWAERARSITLRMLARSLITNAQPGCRQSCNWLQHLSFAPHITARLLLVCRVTLPFR